MRFIMIAKRGVVSVKKLLCVLLLFSLVVSVSAHAESVPKSNSEIVHEMFANHSDEDLCNLFIAVQYELDSRGIPIRNMGDYFKAVEQKEVTVPRGEYVIGKDIPAGDYTVVSLGWLATVKVETSAGKQKGYYCMDEGEQIGKLSLKEGDVLSVTTDDVIFKPYAGLGF